MPKPEAAKEGVSVARMATAKGMGRFLRPVKWGLELWVYGAKEIIAVCFAQKFFCHKDKAPTGNHQI